MGVKSRYNSPFFILKPTFAPSLTKTAGLRPMIPNVKGDWELLEYVMIMEIINMISMTEKLMMVR